MTALARATPKRRRGDTRQRLLESALSVFARHGFDRATIDEIVRDAGFSKGAFYVHFESKEDLFWALLEERIARQQEAFRQAVDPRSPVVENVRTILGGVFALYRTDPLWTAMFMEFGAHALRNEKVRQRLADMYKRWHGLIVEILRASREGGRVRQDIDVEFIASAVIAVVEGTLMQSRLAPDVVRLDEMVEPLARTLADWLEPKAS
ncbi:MAG TPA: TetR/AcrR family transcriptional regulator [Dehalococcoidia bacterium]|nr:TetR/AcrR family transcriptional regulator [Dehalococcoidia bacterium]